MSRTFAPFERARSSLSWTVLAIVLGTLCVLATARAVREQTAFSEYLSQARRCVELDDCPSRGGRAGGLPLFHGHSWIRLLAHSLRAGHDLTWVQDVVLALLIVSVPVTFFWLARNLGLRAAALGLGLYFPVIVAGTDITILTYTNLLPLPFALYYTGLALFLERGRTVFGAVASMALAAAVSAELGSIVMVPFHLGLVGLAAARPLPAMIICGLAFAIPFFLESTDAALEVVRQLPTLRFAIAVAVCGAFVPLLIRVRPYLQPAGSTPVAPRVRAAMLLALVYAALTIWAGNLLLLGGVPAPRYLQPASFPFLYLLAERMGTLAPRAALAIAALAASALVTLSWAPHGREVVQLPVAAIVTLFALAVIVRSVRQRDARLAPRLASWPAPAICLLAIGIAAADIVVIARRGGAQALTLAEAEQLVSKLYGAGYTYPELLASMQGPAADGMISLLTERDPARFAGETHFQEPDLSLLVLKVPSAVVARTARVIAAVPSAGSRAAIVVRGGRSYLDWARARRCVWQSDGHGPGGHRCAQPLLDQPLPHNWPYVRFGEVLPRSVLPAAAEIPRWSVRFEVPVHTPGRGAARIVRTPSKWPASWRFVSVSGVEIEGTLPGEEVRLPDTRPAQGTAELEFQPPLPTELPWVWLPQIVEVDQENEHLLEPFRGRRVDG